MYNVLQVNAAENLEIEWEAEVVDDNESSLLADNLSLSDPNFELNDEVSTHYYNYHLLIHNVEHFSLQVSTDAAEPILEPNVPEVEILEIQDIVQHFKRYPIRESWSWMMNAQQDSAIVLTNVDRVTRQTRIQVDIDSTLSMKVKMTSVIFNAITRNNCSIFDVRRQSAKEM